MKKELLFFSAIFLFFGIQAADDRRLTWYRSTHCGLLESGSESEAVGGIQDPSDDFFVVPDASYWIWKYPSLPRKLSKTRIFYTAEGDKILKTDDIKRVIDPLAPKPKVAKYTVEEKSFIKKLICYDKHNNEIGRYTWHIEHKYYVAIKIGAARKLLPVSYKRESYGPHVIMSSQSSIRIENFPLDLSEGISEISSKTASTLFK